MVLGDDEQWEYAALMAAADDALTRRDPADPARRLVVAADVACLRCLVSDGGNGRLVGVRRPEELAAALLDVLADEARWRALADGARRSIETDWSWDGAADVVQHAYHHAIAGTPYRTVRHAS